MSDSNEDRPDDNDDAELEGGPESESGGATWADAAEASAAADEEAIPVRETLEADVLAALHDLPDGLGIMRVHELVNEDKDKPHVPQGVLEAEVERLITAGDVMRLDGGVVCYRLASPMERRATIGARRAALLQEVADDTVVVWTDGAGFDAGDVDALVACGILERASDVPAGQPTGDENGGPSEEELIAAGDHTTVRLTMEAHADIARIGARTLGLASVALSTGGTEAEPSDLVAGLRDALAQAEEAQRAAERERQEAQQQVADVRHDRSNFELQAKEALDREVERRRGMEAHLRRVDGWLAERNLIGVEEICATAKPVVNPPKTTMFKESRVVDAEERSRILGEVEEIEEEIAVQQATKETIKLRAKAESSAVDERIADLEADKKALYETARTNVRIVETECLVTHDYVAMETVYTSVKSGEVVHRQPLPPWHQRTVEGTDGDGKPKSATPPTDGEGRGKDHPFWEEKPTAEGSPDAQATDDSAEFTIPGIDASEELVALANEKFREPLQKAFAVETERVWVGIGDLGEFLAQHMGKPVRTSEAPLVVLAAKLLVRDGELKHTKNGVFTQAQLFTVPEIDASEELIASANEKFRAHLREAFAAELTAVWILEEELRAFVSNRLDTQLTPSDGELVKLAAKLLVRDGALRYCDGVYTQAEADVPAATTEAAPEPDILAGVDAADIKKAAKLQPDVLKAFEGYEEAVEEHDLAAFVGERVNGKAPGPVASRLMVVAAKSLVAEGKLSHVSGAYWVGDSEKPLAKKKARKGAAELPKLPPKRRRRGGADTHP